MHFSLGRSTLVSDPSALPRSSAGSLLLFWRRLGFTLAFLLRCFLLTLRLVFCLLFSAVLLIVILVGRLIVLQFLVLGSLALCLGSAFGGFVLGSSFVLIFTACLFVFFGEFGSLWYGGSAYSRQEMFK